MGRRIIYILIGLYFSLQVYANGDPVVTYSALALTCTPEPRRIPEIQLVSENLTIDAGCPMSHIRVKYVLKNNSDKYFERIDYGFPIDWFGGSDSARIEDATFYTMAEQEFGWRDDYVQSVSFRIDNQELSWKCSKDTVLREAIDIDWGEDEGDSILEANNYFEDRMGYCETQRIAEIRRKWYYTSFAFEPYQTRVLIVDYQIANRYRLHMDNAYSVFKEYARAYRENPEYSVGDCSLGYDFRPAAYWGNGKTNDMHISLTIPKYHYKDFLPEVIGYEMNQADSTKWYYDSKDFDFSKAKALYVHYLAKICQHEDIEKLQERRVSTDFYHIEATGKDIENLSDNNINSVGQILPNAEGKYQIKIFLNENITLFGMLIYACDCSNREKYIKTVPWKNIGIKCNYQYFEGFSVNCHTSLARSMSLQDLTDAAEKIQFSPYDGEGCREFSPEEFTIEITGAPENTGKPIYVSDIVLLGTDLRKWDEERGIIYLEEK